MVLITSCSHIGSDIGETRDLSVNVILNQEAEAAVQVRPDWEADECGVDAVVCIPQSLYDYLATEEAVFYSQLIENLGIPGGYHDRQVTVLVQASERIRMRVEPVYEDSCSFQDSE